MIRIKLKVMLAEREMTQRTLSDISGVRLPTISSIATGKVKEIPIGVLDKLCAALNCQPGDLIEYKPDKYVMLKNASDAEIEQVVEMMRSKPGTIHMIGQDKTKKKE